MRKEIAYNNSIETSKMFFQRRPSLKIYLSKTERGKVTYNSIKIESLQRDYLTKEAGIVVEIVPPLQQWNNFF